MKLLGTKADEELARRFKRTIRSVTAKRASLGIPSPNPDYAYWTAEEEMIVKSHSIEEAVRLTGRSVHAVRERNRRLGLSELKDSASPSD